MRGSGKYAQPKDPPRGSLAGAHRYSKIPVVFCV